MSWDMVSTISWNGTPSPPLLTLTSTAVVVSTTLLRDALRDDGSQLAIWAHVPTEERRA